MAALSIAACGGGLEGEDAGTSSGTGGGASAGGGSGSAAAGAESADGSPSSVPASVLTRGGSPLDGSAMSGQDATAAGPVVMHRVTTPIEDASEYPAVPSDAAAGCNGSGTSGGIGNAGDACSTFANETCNGVSYTVSCSCPQGTCACQGTSSIFVTFAGCPACPSDLFALCGFPQQ